MKKLIDTIVVYVYKLCCKYIEKHLYVPKHYDTEFWRDKSFFNGDDFN